DSSARFRHLPSALPAVYRSLGSFSEPADDGFLYIPAHLAATHPAPVLVFLHGSGGNFKGYLWVLSEVADRAGCVVVAPGDGLGNWRASETGRRIASALDRAAQVTAIDRHRVHLAGLSNGGLGVCQALAEHGADFKTAILISPVFDSAELA